MMWISSWPMNQWKTERMARRRRQPYHWQIREILLVVRCSNTVTDCRRPVSTQSRLVASRRVTPASDRAVTVPRAGRRRPRADRSTDQPRPPRHRDSLRRGRCIIMMIIMIASRAAAQVTLNIQAVTQIRVLSGSLQARVLWSRARVDSLNDVSPPSVQSRLPPEPKGTAQLD